MLISCVSVAYQLLIGCLSVAYPCLSLLISCLSVANQLLISCLSLLILSYPCFPCFSFLFLALIQVGFSMLSGSSMSLLHPSSLFICVRRSTKHLHWKLSTVKERRSEGMSFYRYICYHVVTFRIVMSPVDNQSESLCWFTCVLKITVSYHDTMFWDHKKMLIPQ